MHVLIPFDIVPKDRQVPQAVFGVAPTSERAVRYALEAFGDEGLEITAIHLSTDTIDLEENMGAAEIRSMAEELGVSADVDVHSVTHVDSMASLRQEVLDVVERAAVDTVVIGYEEQSFVESVFTESTPHAVLEERETPVVLVP